MFDTQEADALHAERPTFNSYLDWAASDLFSVGIQRSGAFGSTGATLISIRQDEAFPDPATPDITIQMCTGGELDLSSDVAGLRYSGRMRRGQFLVTPPHVPIDLSGEGRFEFDVLVLDGKRVHEILEADRADATAAFSRLFGRVTTDVRAESLLRAFWDDIASERIAGGVYADTALAHLLHYLAGSARELPKRASGGLAPWQLRRATEALADADLQALTLAELADMVGLSPFHFCRAFRQSTGITPHRYQVERRMERARSLLDCTSESVTEIAFKAGYQSSQAFAREFRKYTGYSPLEYRTARRTG